MYPNSSSSSRNYWIGLVESFPNNLPILRYGKFINESEFYRYVWTENRNDIPDLIKDIVDTYSSKGKETDSSRINDISTMVTRIGKFVREYSKVCCEMYEIGVDPESVDDLLYEYEILED